MVLLLGLDYQILFVHLSMTVLYTDEQASFLPLVTQISRISAVLPFLICDKLDFNAYK